MLVGLVSDTHGQFREDIRSALAFQQPVDTRTPGYGFPEAVSAGPTAEGSPYPGLPADEGVTGEERLSA